MKNLISHNDNILLSGKISIPFRVILLVMPLLFLGFHLSDANADGFVYEGGKIADLSDEMDDFNDKDGLYWTADWNPEGSKLTKPGFHVAFFGRAPTCGDIKNGKVTGNLNKVFDLVQQQTGLTTDNSAKSFKWAPSLVEGKCAQESKDPVARSYVYLREADKGSGGIGLFTDTGGAVPKDSNVFSFQPYSAKGGRVKGVNAGIVGTFVVFRQDYKKSPVRPWDGDNVLRFDSRQSVNALAVEKGSPKNTQAKQQIAFTVVNEDCLNKKLASATNCHVLFLINTAIARQNNFDWRNGKNFKKASIFFDPAQGGMPIVHGQLWAAGQNTELDLRGQKPVPIWQSLGTETKSAIFNEANFSFKMDFDQFKSVLNGIARYAAIGVNEKGKPKRLNARGARVKSKMISGEGDVAKLYGDTWDNPHAWVLLAVKIGQEVHNEQPSMRTYIGGSVRSIKIN